jgi:hypothetical protein
MRQVALQSQKAKLLGYARRGQNHYFNRFAQNGFAFKSFLHPFYRFEPRAASRGQKPADDFLHEEGQIRLGNRQARRQAKIVAGAR